MSSTDAPRRSSSRIATRSSASHSAAPAAGVAQPKKRAVPAKTDAQSAPVKKAKSEASAPLLGNGDVAAKAGTLTVGERLPSITLQDESGKQIDVSTLKKSVIFTYPKANTGGCTTQACLYRDEYAEFQRVGFSVYGLSSDGLTSLKNWKEKRSFQYSLLSDPKRQLIGALTGSKTSTPRGHFVIDGEGKLALSSISVKPAASSPAALKFAKTL